MTRQTVAPRYQLKAKVLDALAVALLMAFMAAMGVIVMLLSTPQAKADVDNTAYAFAATYGDAVCSTLDSFPTFDGILGIGQAIVKDGLTTYQAGEVIELSISGVCPRHSGLMDRFIAKFAPSAVTA